MTSQMTGPDDAQGRPPHRGGGIRVRGTGSAAGEPDVVRVSLAAVAARPTLVEAMDAIGREAQWRIDGAADLWLARQPDQSRLSMRFDLVAVLPRRWPVHVEDVFSGRT